MGFEKSARKETRCGRNEMLLFACRGTKLDRIRNERIWGTIKVTEISKKVQERRLQWYGHTMRKDEDYVGKRAMEVQVPGRRNRVRPKRRWLDSVKVDLKEKVLRRKVWKGMNFTIGQDGSGLSIMPTPHKGGKRNKEEEELESETLIWLSFFNPFSGNY